MKHYRHRVTIEAQAIGKDAYGQETNGWATIATVWALVMPVDGGESFNSGAVAAVGSLTVEMWYRADVTSACRIKYGNRTFEIDSVTNEDELNRKLILKVKETT